jgi:hypothetical protein
VIDIGADEFLPALVCGVALQLAERRREIVALDKMEEVAAAAPDRPVSDPGTAVGLDQVVGIRSCATSDSASRPGLSTECRAT